MLLCFLEPLKVSALKMVKAGHLLCLSDINGSLSIHSPSFCLPSFFKDGPGREVLKDWDKWKCESPEL